MTLILGIDPGLRFTGYGLIKADKGRLAHVANGTIKIGEKLPMPERLAAIHRGLAKVLEEYSPAEAAIEETFVNMNPSSTLRLGQARGVAILTPGLYGVPVAEYSPNLVKKSVVGLGHAGKDQIEMMVGVLLGKPKIDSEHAADALAIAICHAHNRTAPK
jgi:crossover junction endodeoxyribonuclease RuvC